MLAYRTKINNDISKPRKVRVRYSKDCNLGTRHASVKRFSRACTALSADMSNLQSDFYGSPLFLERVTNTNH